MITPYYANLTPKQFRERLSEAPIAYLPLGTLEWHGEHLPLGSDGHQPIGFFELLAREVGGIILPMLFLGPDRHEVHDGEEFIGMDLHNFPEGEQRKLDGNAYWVPDDLFAKIMAGVLRQLKRAGFTVVVAHGHGPSVAHVMERTAQWEKEFDLCILTCRNPEADKDCQGIQSDHAAANETSLMMALRPDLVKMENLVPNPEVKPIGVWGEDPRTGASAERGQEILETQAKWMVKRLCEALGG